MVKSYTKSRCFYFKHHRFEIPNDPGGLALNPLETRAYIAVQNQTIPSGDVILCNIIDSVTGALTGCTSQNVQDFSGVTSPTGLAGIALNADGSIAYVVDQIGNQVYQCSIDAGTGAFTSCISVNSGPPFSVAFANPTGIVITKSGQYAYVGNFNFSGTGFVSVCQINSVTGGFDDCIDAVGSSGAVFGNPTGVTLNVSNQGLYVVNFSLGTVSLCQIDPTPINNGVFTSCATAVSGLNNPEFVALNAPNEVAYVTQLNLFGPIVSRFATRCAVEDNGVFACDDSGVDSDFTSAAGIILKSS